MLEYSNGRPIDSYQYNSSNLAVPDRFDANNIGTNTLSISSTFGNADNISSQAIIDEIYRQRIPNKILKSILIDPSTNTMTTSVIEKRGLYNASDADFAMAKNTARGIDILKDAGIKLLQNIYFLVIKPTYYNSSKDDNTKANVFTFSGSATLFQLNLDSVYMAKQFWDEFYFDSPNQKMLDKLMNYRFPLKSTYLSFSVTKTDLDGANKANVALQGLGNLLSGTKKAVDESQLTRKSLAQVNKELIQGAVKNLLASVQEEATFTVKSSIYSTFPLQSKIGKKEGVRTDNLFMVQENVLDPKTGKKSLRKVGYVRAKWVADNRYSTSGKTKPSSFYRATSGKIRKGMLLTEVSESPFTMGFEYGLDNTNPLSGAIISIDYRTHWLPGFSVGFNASYNTVQTEGVTYGYTKQKGYLSGDALSGSLFFKQSFNFNYISIAPLGGIYVSYLPINNSTVPGISNSDISNKYKDLHSVDLGLMYGGTVGINIGRTVQLYAGYYYTASAEPTTKYGENYFPYTLSYSKSTMVAGIRLFRL